MAESAKVKKAVAAVNDVLFGKSKNLSSDDMEALVKVATDILNRDYWDDVRGVAADILERAKEGEFKDMSEVSDAVHEAVENTQRVIYTFQASLGLISTNNADAYEEEFGEKPSTIEAQMSVAMQRDVDAQLSGEDIEGIVEGEA